jgi:hypothetical protein
VVRVSDSSTCWGRHAKTPNKFGTPIGHPRKFPQIRVVIRTVFRPGVASGDGYTGEALDNLPVRELDGDSSVY